MYNIVQDGKHEIVDPSEKDNLYKQLIPSFDELLGAVAGHEGKHATDKHANIGFVGLTKSEEAADKFEIKIINELKTQKQTNTNSTTNGTSK